MAVFALLLWLTRDLTFMQDEWDFLQTRRANDDEAFLRPHNNHLFALVVALYKLLWSTVGLAAYWPYRATAIALHLTCVALLFELVRRRVGATLALAACLPVLVLGSAWEVLLIPFNYGWYLSLAALLTTVLVLDRGGLGWDVAIAVLLLVSLASSSFGVPMAAGLAAACLIERRWRRMAMLAVPTALYAAWFTLYAIDAENQPRTDLTASPEYFANTAAGSIAALAGVPLGIEPLREREPLVALLHVLTAVLFAALAYRLATRRQAVTPTLALVVTSVLGYWLVLTVTRGHTDFAYTSRYLYIGPVLVVLLAAECLRGVALPGRLVAAVLGGALLTAAANAAVLVHYSGERRHDALVLRAELGALETLRGRVPDDFNPDRDRSRAVTIRAGLYFGATDEIGSSPAPTPDQLERMPDFARRAGAAVRRRAAR